MPGLPSGVGFTAAAPSMYPAYAQRLAAETGLDYTVALDWMKAEGSTVPGNPLGLTNGHGVFATFSSWQAGIDAIAAELRSSSYYSGIRAAIATGSPAAQRAAIIASPWDLGHYGNGAKFPTLPGSVGAGGSPNAHLTAAQWNAVIASLPPGTRYVTASDVAAIETAAAAHGLNLQGLNWPSFYGKSVSQLRDALAARGSIPPADPGSIPGAVVGDVAGAVGGAVLGWLAPFSVDLLLLGAALLLAVLGLRKILG